MTPKTNITLEEAKSIRLSTNFTLAEFIKSDIAIRRGIDNSLPIKYLEPIQYLVKTILQPVRDKFGSIKITSGYRSEELTEAVGSSMKSNHTRGLAVDIEPIDPDVSLTDILKYIHDELEYKELIAEFFPGGWVHVAAEEGNNKATLKLKDSGHNYARVDIEEITSLYV